MVRRRAVVAAFGPLLLSGVSSGCTATATAPETAAGAEELRAAVDRWAAAVRSGDLAGVELASWSYRITRARQDGDGRATVRAELGYRIAGYDSGPVTTERALRLARRDGRWQVTSDRPAQGAAQQLWDQGALQVVRGRRSLVLGSGQDPERLRAVAATADRAVPAVSAAWAGPWPGRVVVLVPGSLEGMGALLGAPADRHRGIAAVTTGRAGGGPDAPADRVVVNPEAYTGLSGVGQDMVLTHETAHVATRTHTSAATPMWLSEGFADWAAYRGTAHPAGQAAPALRDAVRAGLAPAGLPSDGDFAFTGDAEALARAYEGGWLACALIADRWGEPELRAFYRAVGAHRRREAREQAVSQALREVLGTTPEEFTARWRGYVRERLG
ncbi:hypothetical protein AB0A69_02475 [Streptomyces sp. NPDC045431]|uniref:hypothetical protein n=1 Tax=Streptomyces sp. NPDC045431 TaxID=3155613 RepID=UPI0033F35E29